MNLKEYLNLALEIVERFHDENQAKQAKADFNNRFSKGNIPEDIETINFTKDDIKLANLLKQANLTSSTSEALRLINQGAVKINEQKVTEDYLIKADLVENKELIIRVGKRKIIKLIFN